MAYVRIGGAAVGTVLTLIFFPGLYAISFHAVPGYDETHAGASEPSRQTIPN